MSGEPAEGARWRAWDVFVSYKKKDGERARTLVDALEREGFTVWWDRHIPPGESWPRIIEQSLDASSAVVALWTVESVADVGGWVHIEARRAKGRNALVPVLVDPVEPPLEFSSVQAANLTDWDGEQGCDGLDNLIASVRALVAADDRATRSPEQVKADVAERRRWAKRTRVLRVAIPTLGSLFWIAAAAVLSSAEAPATSLTLDDMTVESVRADVAERSVERSEVPVGFLIVSGNDDLESVRLNVPGSAEPVRVHAGVERLVLSGGGEGSRLTIDPQDYPAGSRIELQRDGEDLRLTSPDLDLGRRSLRVRGTWTVRLGRDRETVDFGDRGTIDIVSRQPIYFDLQPAAEPGEITLFERVPISDLEFSEFVLYDPSGEADPTIVGGTLTATGGVSEELGTESALGWDTFDGTLSRLWLEDGAIRATVDGQSVSGLRLNGVDRMPSLFASLEPTRQITLVAAMGLILVGLLVSFVRLARARW